MKMKNVCLSLLIGLAFVEPVFAASDLEQGAKFYQAKEYAKARPLFEKAIKQSPRNWQAHYYLANTLLAMGEKAKAIKEYEACQKTCTDAAVNEHCLVGIKQASMIAPPGAATPAPVVSRAKPTTGTTGSSASPGQFANEVLEEERRERIMRTAKEEVARIRREAKEQLQHEKASSNQIFRYGDGSVGADISDEREEEIERETEAKCRKVMEDAEFRIKGSAR